ncbi:hypothetical protein [Holdemania filiformis]|uniref:hypothetical protein n=1 Tax=Holdemania filiformis TaxID=61171 RepID=UPI0026747D01|nr:hypothetical protein [Holdemania filiformis]
MRRQILCLMAAALLLISGCSKKDPNQISTEKMQLYTAYYKSIMEMDRFQEKSDFYDLEVVMNQLPDGTYRYYVILDNPRVAMVDVEMLVVDAAVDYSQISVIAPSVGLLENEDYSLIPNQVYPELGYVKGLMASGETTSPIVSLNVMVLWKDYAKLKETREYLQLTGDFENQSTTPEAEPEPEGAHDDLPTEDEGDSE